MSEHTPGEWEANRYDEIWSVEVLDGGGSTLRTFIGTVHDIEAASQAKANARLIAAAPDLLEALLKRQEVHQHYISCQDCEDDGTLCERAGELEDEEHNLREAAITKAEGR